MKLRVRARSAQGFFVVAERGYRDPEARSPDERYRGSAQWCRRIHRSDEVV